MEKLVLVTVFLFPALFACGALGLGEGSLAERVDVIQEELARLDKDTDGKVSLGELIAAIGAVIGTAATGAGVKKMRDRKLAEAKAKTDAGTA